MRSVGKLNLIWTVGIEYQSCELLKDLLQWV